MCDIMQVNFPENPEVGQKFGTSYGYYMWDGTKWLLSKVSPKDPSTGEIIPDNPQLGQLWWSSILANLFIYVNNVWIPVGSHPKSYPSLPISGIHALKSNGETVFWELVE